MSGVRFAEHARNMIRRTRPDFAIRTPIKKALKNAMEAKPGFFIYINKRTQYQSGGKF